MLKVVENEEYLDTAGVMFELEASKKAFYENVHPQLRAYRFGASRTPWYLRRDVLALKHGHLEQTAPIMISGILRDWTEHVRALGYQVDTKNRAVEVVVLPKNAATAFTIAATRQFVRRSRISLVNSVPICIWESYYPMELVQGFLEDIRHDEELDVVKRIKEACATTVTWAKERYSARMTNKEEQRLLQLRDAEPVLILQRVSTTSDRKTLVLYSHMTLLGRWFSPEHEYAVDIWNG